MGKPTHPHHPYVGGTQGKVRGAGGQASRQGRSLFLLESREATFWAVGSWVKVAPLPTWSPRAVSQGCLENTT